MPTTVQSMIHSTKGLLGLRGNVVTEIADTARIGRTIMKIVSVLKKEINWGGCNERLRLDFGAS